MRIPTKPTARVRAITSRRAQIDESVLSKWCSKGCFIEAIEVFLNPYFYLINNKSPNYSGWETHKIQYGLKIIYVTLRAKEVDYDKEMIKTVKQPWYAYKFVKYEVKPNCYGIEEIWFIKDKGWFVAGEELALWRVYQ